MTIRVVSPGAFTTVQDLGRPGWGSAGVPPGGAMDTLALRAANLIAGNPPEAAALEITMSGPTLTFEADVIVALAGAPIDTDINGERMPDGWAIRWQAGEVLRLGAVHEGVRAYLAVHGGIDVPEVLGSRSTLAAASFGGVNGRPLKARDYLRAGVPEEDPRFRSLHEGFFPLRSGVVRAIPGPQDDAFTARGREEFWSSEFRVSPRSDRAGVRLEGPAIEHAFGPDIDPEGVVTGSIQIPGDGHPIVLGPDRPATGGYAKIATVIAADLPLIAQARPGAPLRFVPVTVDEALAAWREREVTLAEAIEELT